MNELAESFSETEFSPDTQNQIESVLKIAHATGFSQLISPTKVGAH